MAKHQQKLSENKTEKIAANISGGKTTVQLKDNREPSVVQKKLSDKTTKPESSFAPIQKKNNNTGLPDNLKAGMENLSNKSLDHVKVHYNSSKPASLQAHAYAQGSNIHLGPGQEKHLPHELGHVVQQMEGRVKPTMKIGGTAINNDPSLEQEATHMGQRAIQRASFADAHKNVNPVQTKKTDQDHTFQFKTMDHLGIPGVNYAIMSQAGYGQWQKTAQAKFMSSAHHNGDQVVVTQFQSQNEVQQYFLSSAYVGGFVILEGLLSLAASAVILSSSNENALIPGFMALGVGLAKIVRGITTIIGADTTAGKVIIDLLRGVEAALALTAGITSKNKAVILFGAAKALRSLLHGIIDYTKTETPSLTNKIATGFAAVIHWIEVIAVTTSGSMDIHSGETIKKITGGLNIGVAASKTVRSSNQTAGAIKTISPPEQPDANSPLLA